MRRMGRAAQVERSATHAALMGYAAQAMWLCQTSFGRLTHPTGSCQSTFSTSLPKFSPLNSFSSLNS
jgi:hypothetical protein